MIEVREGKEKTMDGQQKKEEKGKSSEEGWERTLLPIHEGQKGWREVERNKSWIGERKTKFKDTTVEDDRTNRGIKERKDRGEDGGAGQVEGGMVQETRLKIRSMEM